MSWGTSLSGFAETAEIFEQVKIRWGEDVTYVVGPSAKYGIYQEFGTSKMKPQPYLRPATRDVMRSLPRIESQVDSSAELTKTIALEIEGLAKRFAPEKTGNLKGSISTERIR